MYIIYSNFYPQTHSSLLPISLSSLFIAVVKHQDPKQLREGCLLQLTANIKGSQAPTWKQEAMEEHCLLA